MRGVLLSAAAALGAASFAGAAPSAADAHTSSSGTATGPLARPVTLGRRTATLHQCQVVFRHGARTPLSDEAYLWRGVEWNVGGSPYEPVPMQLLDVNGGPAPENAHDLKQRNAKLPGGTSKGELTLVGKLQALELGYWLRQQYIDSLNFLPASYRPGVLAARTTNFSRTRATMAGVLTGLYPGTTEPVPVTTSGDLDEILYADTKRCPHLKVLMSASEAMLKAHWESPARAPQLVELQQQLSRVFDLPDGAWSRRWMMTDVHDVIQSLTAHGKPLPPGLTQAMREEVDRLATEEISAFICPALEDDHGHAVLRLSMGRLLDTLLANMDAAHRAAVTVAPGGSSGGGSGTAGPGGSGSGGTQQQPKLLLYSGHDSTVMPLLAALGLEVKQWPPYISNLVFELWELQPPPLPSPRSSMAGGGSSSSSRHADAASRSPAAFAVRVLFNKQPLNLPGASEANPTLLELQHFREQVLAPFLLSAEQHEQACAVRISHDGALPRPEAGNGGDLNLASGSAGASSSSTGGSGGGSAAGGSRSKDAKL